MKLEDIKKYLKENLKFDVSSDPEYTDYNQTYYTITIKLVLEG